MIQHLLLQLASHASCETSVYPVFAKFLVGNQGAGTATVGAWWVDTMVVKPLCHSSQLDGAEKIS